MDLAARGPGDQYAELNLRMRPSSLEQAANVPTPCEVYSSFAYMVDKIST